VQRFYYENHDQLRRHLAAFPAAYNFGRNISAIRRVGGGVRQGAITANHIVASKMI
jgi:hypothetical protein